MNSINIYLINIIQVVFFTSTPLNSCAKHEWINEPYNWLVETIWKMQVGNAKIAFAELINMELAKLVLHSLWDWRGIVPRSPVFHLCTNTSTVHNPTVDCLGGNNPLFFILGLTNQYIAVTCICVLEVVWNSFQTRRCNFNPLEPVIKRL